MAASFLPLLRNPHALTILGNFWPRSLHPRYPSKDRYYQTEPEVRILAHEQRPLGPSRAELILLHGLEGSSSAGYMVSMAQDALLAGLAATRLNMRTCGGTEHLCPTLYHAGLTSDLRRVLEIVKNEDRGPVFLCGFSLGGNVVLKLAGELGPGGSDLLAGVCAVGTPLHLGACVDKMAEPQNRLYEHRFVQRLKARYRRRQQQAPDRFPARDLDAIRTVLEFDDRITAPAFGFRGARHYYDTQSAIHFLPRIAVPTLLIQAQDDPLIPFSLYQSDAVRGNECITLVAPEHGGHLGFIARRRPRFWADTVVLHWIQEQILRKERLPIG
ncbi:MAG: alpha/beta fold hydrolase [Bryobacteraceae bacterium]|nr:alpha/beta fold hydrolase [Bryobacteraceae bacterium]